MQRVKLGTLTLLSGALLVFVHIRALQESWYWQFPWFDTGVHFLGGVFVAFFLLYTLLLIRGRLFYNEAVQTAFVLLGTFIIGVLWEVFEHFFNISFDPLESFDTVLDLLMDTLGAFTVNTMINRSLKKDKTFK